VLLEDITAKAVLNFGVIITTDHIMPVGAKILPYRSNIPHLSQYCFAQCDPNFAENCKTAVKSIVIGGANYGQGSSREHAALVPLYLGVKAVVVKSFARMHLANLVNAGIMPLTFKDPADYDKITVNDELKLANIREIMKSGGVVTLENLTTGESYALDYALSPRQREILLAGGLLDYTRMNG